MRILFDGFVIQFYFDRRAPVRAVQTDHDAKELIWR